MINVLAVSFALVEGCFIASSIAFPFTFEIEYIVHIIAFHLPVYPWAHEHVYCSSDFKLHVPPCWHGDESHAFFSCISHSDAVKPMGQEHVNTGVPSLKLTVHVPPFWHLGPGPVWHGLGYWQNSPTYREEQLQIKRRNFFFIITTNNMKNWKEWTIIIV